MIIWRNATVLAAALAIMAHAVSMRRRYSNASQPYPRSIVNLTLYLETYAMYERCLDLLLARNYRSVCAWTGHLLLQKHGQSIEYCRSPDIRVVLGDLRRIFISLSCLARSML